MGVFIHTLVEVAKWIQKTAPQLTKCHQIDKIETHKQNKNLPINSTIVKHILNSSENDVGASDSRYRYNQACTHEHLPIVRAFL